MSEKLVTKEFDRVLSYMTDSLSKEFGNNILTPEFLLTAILDDKKCHAYYILDSFLMSNNIESLRDVYLGYLEEHKSKPNFRKTEEVKFNEELTNIISEAYIEQEEVGSELLGTEHLLLSILNQNNKHTKLLSIFCNIGVDYNIIRSKCKDVCYEQSNQKKDNKPFKIAQPKQHVNQIQPLSKTSFINQYTININKLVRSGKVDSLIGRESECDQILKTLVRRKKNNAVLVGNGGCGKTQIVYGVAEMIESNNAPKILDGKEIVMMNIMALVSGTQFRGMFEERVNGLFDELKKNTKYILFIDDIQNVLKGVSKEKDTDISSMISNVLSEGDIRIIATTTFKDYHNTIEQNQSISRKFHKIVIEPTTKEDSVEILMRSKHYYEEFHNVTYSLETIEKIVDLADRYVTDKSLPDSAIDIMDMCGANVNIHYTIPNRIKSLKRDLSNKEDEKSSLIKNGDFEEADKVEKDINSIKSEISDFNREFETEVNSNKKEITVSDVANVVSEMTNIPTSKLTADEKEKLSNIEGTIGKFVVGQDEAVKEICKIVKRSKVGLTDKNKPTGVALLLGPTGCGKCVCENVKIKIRNKHTQEITELTMREFYDKIK